MRICKKLRLLLIAAVWLQPVFATVRPVYEEDWERSANDRQPPDRVMDAIGIKPGMIVGEIGAGRGRYTVHLANRVGEKGKIFANDIDQDALAYLQERLRRNHIGNVLTVLGREDDPLLPKNSLDMAIMVWVYHHVSQPIALLKNLIPSLKPGAAVVIIDPNPERDGEKDSERPSTKASVEKEARAAGFELARIETFLARDLIFVLRLPAEENPKH
jgi:ubiquinone/menaquinone biosynthesis C-methylase UbiE